jgi:hypothetical protein
MGNLNYFLISYARWQNQGGGQPSPPPVRQSVTYNTGENVTYNDGSILQYNT